MFFNFLNNYKQDKHNRKDRKISDKYFIDISNLNLIEIEIFSYCNRQCWFCPNSFIDRHSKNILMNEKVYLNILKDLKKIKYSETISYSRYNEPLSHLDIFTKRLKQTRKFLPNAILHTNTNGDFLTKEVLSQLYEAGLNSLNIQNYLKENEEFNIEDLKQKIIKKAEQLNVNYKFVKENERIVKAEFEFENMEISMYARNFKITGNNRGESLDLVKPKRRKVPCYIPFTDLYVDYNGNVMPCCNLRSDILEHQKFILGNVAQRSILKIFNDRPIRSMREMLSMDKINIKPCKHCNFALGKKLDVKK